MDYCVNPINRWPEPHGPIPEGPLRNFLLEEMAAAINRDGDYGTVLLLLNDYHRHLLRKQNEDTTISISPALILKYYQAHAETVVRKLANMYGIHNEGPFSQALIDDLKIPQHYLSGIMLPIPPHMCGLPEVSEDEFTGLSRFNRPILPVLKALQTAYTYKGQSIFVPTTQQIEEHSIQRPAFIKRMQDIDPNIFTPAKPAISIAQKHRAKSAITLIIRSDHQDILETVSRDTQIAKLVKRIYAAHEPRIPRDRTNRKDRHNRKRIRLYLASKPTERIYPTGNSQKTLHMINPIEAEVIYIRIQKEDSSWPSRWLQHDEMPEESAPEVDNSNPPAKGHKKARPNRDLAPVNLAQAQGNYFKNSPFHQDYFPPANNQHYISPYPAIARPIQTQAQAEASYHVDQSLQQNSFFPAGNNNFEFPSFAQPCSAFNPPFHGQGEAQGNYPVESFLDPNYSFQAPLLAGNTQFDFIDPTQTYPVLAPPGQVQAGASYFSDPSVDPNYSLLTDDNQLGFPYNALPQPATPISSDHLPGQMGVLPDLSQEANNEYPEGVQNGTNETMGQTAEDFEWTPNVILEDFAENYIAAYPDDPMSDWFRQKLRSTRNT